MMRVSEAEVVARLRASGSVFAEDEARVLVSSALSRDDLESMILRRTLGEPLEVVVGWAEFCGHRVVVESGVFVPRTRSAILVDEGARLIGPGAVVVDLCCGTGAVGLALSARVGGIELYASDIEPSAVHCARRNLDPIGAEVFEGDLFSALPARLRGRVDLVVVNAPYVPSASISTMPPEAREYEPRIALDGGPDGVNVHRWIATGAAEWLAPGGHLVIETSRHQAPLTEKAVRRGGFVSRVVTSVDVDGTAVVGAFARS